MISTNGINHFILSSAFQKSIRRGLPEDALHYAWLYSENIWLSYLIKRLLIILVEDIWFRNLFLAGEMYNFINNEPMMNKDDKIKRLNNLIVKFCISPKSREIDNCICNYWLLGGIEDEEFFDLRNEKFMWLDKTSFNRHIWKFNPNIKTVENIVNPLDRKGLFAFLELEDCEVNTKIDKDGLYIIYNEKLKNLLKSFSKDMPDRVEKIYIKLFFALKERDKWRNSSMLYSTFFYLFDKFAKSSSIYSNYWYLDKIILMDDNYFTSFDYKKPREIPDYVFDKHTTIWNKLKRNFVHFFTKRWLLINEVPIFNNYYKNKFLSSSGLGKLTSIDKKHFNN